MRKRFFTSFLVVITLLSLVACGSDKKVPSTEKPAEVAAYTKSNPAPIGTSIDIVDEEHTVQIKVVSIIRGEDAIKQIAEWNSLNTFEPKKEGTELLLINVEYMLLKAKDGKSFNPNILAFKAFSSSGAEYEMDMVTFGSEQSGEIYEGATTADWLGFEVSKDDTTPTLRYSYYTENEGWYALYSE